LPQLRYRGRGGEYPTAEPQSDPQTEAPSVGNYEEFVDPIHQALVTLTVTVHRQADLLDVAWDQRELRLDRVSGIAHIFFSSGASQLLNVDMF
jgi:hypothetical protein